MLPIPAPNKIHVLVVCLTAVPLGKYILLFSFRTRPIIEVAPTTSTASKTTQSTERRFP